MKTLINWLACVALLFGMSACSQMPNAGRFLSNAISPYKVDLLQGNVITAEQVSSLRVGMGRDEVIAVLGTPLLQSVFHADRWDYIFSFKRQGEPLQSRRLSVFFDGPNLVQFEGDPMPKESEFVESINRSSEAVDPATLKASAESLEKFVKQNPPPPTSPAPSASAQTQYPPLQTSGGLLQ